MIEERHIKIFIEVYNIVYLKQSIYSSKGKYILDIFSVREYELFFFEYVCVCVFNLQETGSKLL